MFESNFGFYGGCYLIRSVFELFFVLVIIDLISLYFDIKLGKILVFLLVNFVNFISFVWKRKKVIYK